jgi:hypothetical protein
MKLSPRKRLVVLLLCGLAGLALPGGVAAAAGTPGSRARAGRPPGQNVAAATRPTPPPREEPPPPQPPPPPPPPGDKPPLANAESVALFEYRNDVKQLADLPERLTQALTQNTSLNVINHQEARRRLGPGIDAEVARCDGETRCLSQVGRRLGAREVLLLAVSQLGDVVMALQRIDVSDQRVLGRYADSIVSGQNVDEARILGWLEQLYPPETFKRYGQIRITTDVSGAQVYVNARARGKTPLAAPLQVLAPGSYRLLVEKDKFVPFQASISVMPDTVVEVSAPLVREGKEKPWYRRWYVWAGITAGVAAVVATGVAIKLATDKPPPDMTMVPGTVVFK